MKQVKIGDDWVSAMGVGAMSFAEFYGPTSDQNSYAILDAAREAGVTHIDTSNMYGLGRSEQAIGDWLRLNPGAREAMHIATKGGINRQGTSGKVPYDNSLQHLEAALEASLNRLGVDCVDLYYVHRRDHEVPIEEVAGSLGRLVEAGKTRAIGFSEIAPSSLRRAVAQHPVAAVQSEYSLATRFPELGLVQTCAELGVALVAFSPVGRSLLTDAPLPAEVLPDLPFLSTNPRFLEPNLSANLAITDKFRHFAKAYGEPAAAIAIAWLLSRGEHVLPIPGTRSTAHFADLLRGTQITLAPEHLTEIDSILPVGWAHGDRYSDAQWNGPERYC